MAEMFDDILDKCIDRINRGERIEDCLADYPEYAEDLKPLLKSMLLTKDAYSFVPRASAKQEARQRFNAALRESERQQDKSRLPFPWILGRARAWAAIATMVMVAFGGYFGVMQLTSQVTSPGIIPVESDSEGNFAFFISDAPNAISDFQSLDLNVSMIRLHQKDGDWVEFEPDTNLVDLTQLQGDLAQLVWRGDVPEGQYSGAILYVANTSGMLKNSGKTVDIGLIGDRLRLDIDFEVANGEATEATEFVYDITVQGWGFGRYNLQPVAGESGTGKKIQNVYMQGQG